MSLVKIQRLLFQLGFVILSSCVSPFEPPVISAKGYLVVDGHLFIEDGSAIVKITRSQALKDTSTSNFEVGCNAVIEDENGNLFTLLEKGKGVYSASGFNFNYGVNYKLNLKTSSGNEYASTFIKTNETPEIDSLNFELGDNSNWLINVNTHDPNNNTYYYRWEFEETWEYVSGANSRYIYNQPVIPGGSGTVDLRTDNIYRCWLNDKSKNILTNSTKRLTRDIVSNFTINSIKVSTRKLDRNYSIQVRQYALTESEFNYWDQLRKNTETTGSIFDPQPTQITGNMTCLTDRNEVVLGYFSPYSVKRKRIKRNYNQFDPSWIKDAVEQCYFDSIPFANINTILPNFLVIDIYSKLGINTGYLVTVDNCADCRSSQNGGGSNVEPDFMK